MKSLFFNSTRDSDYFQNDTEVTTEELVAVIFNIYFTPTLIFFGIIGNLLSIIVFFKRKLRGQSTSQYLSALAISDTVFLMQLIPPWLKMVQWSTVFARDGFCQTFMYFSYVSSAYSSWLVVSFTVERFVAVLYPLQRARMCTVRRARMLILGMAALCLAINTPVLVFVTPRGNDCNLDVDFMDHAARFNMLDTIFTFTLPLAIITVLNIWIMIGVYRLSRARGQLLTAAPRPRQRRGDGSTSGRRRAPTSLQRSQQRITRMLLIVSTVFVFLNLPAYTMRIAAYANNMSNHSGRWAALQQIFLSLSNTNFGINFFLYCMTGQNFRRSLCQAFPCFTRISRLVQNLCCWPEEQDRPPQPTATNSLSINTEATSNAATISVVNLSNVVSEDPHNQATRQHGYQRLWRFDNSRQRQRKRLSTYEMASFPNRFSGLQPDQPERPIAPPSLQLSGAMDTWPARFLYNATSFIPIPYTLDPGEIAPYVDGSIPLTPTIEPQFAPPPPPHLPAAPIHPQVVPAFYSARNEQPLVFNEIEPMRLTPPQRNLPPPDWLSTPSSPCTPVHSASRNARNRLRLIRSPRVRSRSPLAGWQWPISPSPSGGSM